MILDTCPRLPRRNGVLGAISALMLMIGFPLTAAAQDGRDNARTERPAQLEQRGLSVKASRPLAISKLKTSGISAVERIALRPKYAVKKPARTDYTPAVRRNVVVVKFVDGARIREDNASEERRMRTDKGTLLSRLEALKPQLATLDDYDRDLLKRRNLPPDELERQMRKARDVLKARNIVHWRKVFEIDDRLLAQASASMPRFAGSGRAPTWPITTFSSCRMTSRASNWWTAERARRRRAGLSGPDPEGCRVAPTTPSFQNSQSYLGAAPLGIDAKYAWTIPGGTGNLVKIIDVESGWNLNHEDLPSVFLTDGRIADDDSRQHGTAVLGVMLGRQDGVGVTGIVPNASGGVVSVNRGLGIAYHQNVAEAVLLAAMKLSEGDVILIEQHSRGPGNNGDCTACINSDGKPRDQCGYIAMEYWNDIFDAVNAATASGIIVVEAAGNGEMNLDHARYDDRFNRNVRNSGALFVGGGDSSDHKPWCWSNHGSRLDVQGWGDSVMTAGYGSSSRFKVNGADDNQWYTSTFSGTSSATPIVAGAVAAIQGIQIANNNPPLDWYEMADLLATTGTPQTGAKNIGPLPDLKAAIAKLDPPTKIDAVYETVIALGAKVDADRAVSGFAGERTRTIGVNADLGAIERLEFGERSDEPCYVKVEKADIVANSILTPHSEVDICEGTGDGPKDDSLEYVPLVTPDHDTFVRGVAVCNSKTHNSTRLKGVKLYRTRIEGDGSFTMISNPSTMDRVNCDDSWHEPAMCPSGTVATDLVVHIRPDGNKEVFTGLSLKCKSVEVTKTCVSGC